MTDTLKTCPFCGGAADIKLHDGCADTWIARCINPACKVSSSTDCLPFDEATEAWNARALLAEQARTEPDSFTLLARVRDALPVPERGSTLEQLWAAAMADPGSVPEYVRASLAQTHKAEDAPSDIALETIASELQYWLDCNSKGNPKALVFDDITVTPPVLPSRGVIKNWISAICAAIAQERKA